MRLRTYWIGVDQSYNSLGSIVPIYIHISQEISKYYNIHSPEESSTYTSIQQFKNVKCVSPYTIEQGMNIAY